MANNNEPWLVYNTPFGKRYFSVTRLWARRWVKVLALLAAIGFPFAVRFGLPVVSPVYHRVRAEGYDAKARAYLAAGDAGSAALMVENALRHDSSPPARIRLYAETLQAAGRPNVAEMFLLAWIKSPQDEKLAVQAMQTATRTRSFVTGNILIPLAMGAFPKNGELAFQASALQALQGDIPTAGINCRRAMELDPANKDYKFAFCSLQLSSGEAKAAKMAEDSLAELMKDPKFRVRALTLLATYRAAIDPAGGLKLWDEVLGSEPENFDAKLARVAVQSRLDNSNTVSQIEMLRARATNVNQKVQLVDTAFSMMGASGARPLLTMFSPEEKRLLPVMVIQCNVAAAEDRWPLVLDVVASTEGIPMEALDRLVLSLWKLRAETIMGNDSAALATRHEALAYAGRDAERAVKSGQLLEQWGLAAQAADFYEQAALVEGPFQVAALNHLFRLSTDLRDAKRNLLATEGLVKRMPNDAIQGNNLASIMMVLGIDIPRAAELAAKAHKAFPEIVPVTDTYARSLTLIGKPEESVAIYAALDASALTDGGIRVNYADALSRVGKHAEAAALVKDVSSTQVFPEQLRLLEDLRSGTKGP